MATGLIKQVTNNTGSLPNQGYYCKMPDGTMIQWGDSTIDVTAAQPDRKHITYPVPFYAVPSVSLVVIENSYNYQPSLLWWQTGDSKTDLWVLNRGTTPSRHVIFSWIAIGRWK